MKLSRMVRNGTARMNGATLDHVDFNFHGTVEIDMDVRHIGDSAFADCKHITEIKIPEGVETINAGAFMGCTSLKDLEIPNSVEKIGDYALYGCTGLERVTMPQEAQRGNHIFDGGTNPAIVNYTSEHGAAFGVMNTERAIETGYINANLSDLVEEGKAKVNAGILEHLDPTFKGGLNIDMPVHEIGSQAFNDCKHLTEVNIPDSVTEIGSGAFMGCKSLTELKMPDGVERVGDYAMYGCSGLQEATLPQSAKVGEHVFDGCDNLAVVNYTTENGAAIGVGNSEKMIEHGYINANLSDLVAEGRAFVSDGCLDRVDPTFKGGINIDMDIDQISSMAFCDCKHVTEINIPDGVSVVGAGAFMGCTSLTELRIPDSVEHIGDYAMYGCTGLEEVTMPQQAHRGDHIFDGGTEPNYVTYTNENGAAVGVASSSEVSLDEYVDRNGRDSNSSSKDDVNDNANDNENDGGFDL